MPEQPPPTIHYGTPASALTAFCGEAEHHEVSTEPGEVTCFACRKSPAFKRAQLASPPVPLAEVIADTPELEKLRVEANLRGMKNERGMYVIEESIHHGDYRSIRRVEVYEINEATVNAVLISSAYCYGDWANETNPGYRHHRRQALATLVKDLRHLRENRSIGWSTFRLIK